LGLLGVSGCSTDNETEAAKLAKDMGDPGKRLDTPKEPTNLPPATTQKEAFEQRGSAGKSMSPDYPGMKTKKK